MWQRYKNRGVQVLALSMSEAVADPFKKIRAFRKAHKVTYPILSDNEATIVEKFGFSGPNDVIIDRNGRFVGHPSSISDIVAYLKKHVR